MPLSDGHAQPDWIGGGSESRQMMQHAASTDEDIRQNDENDANTGKAVCFQPLWASDHSLQIPHGALQLGAQPLGKVPTAEI